ncbi:helix-turn-helix domain-containing protein [bacterium]|nr:helix-turn-helix domain-containing protein [bacterium]
MNTNDQNAQREERRSPPKRPPMDAPVLLRPEEVARRLNIGGRTMWRWVAEGTFPSPDLRQGRVVRWKRETVDAWLEGRCSENGGQNGK